METNLALQQTIAQLLKIDESRISIEGDRAIIQCVTDAEDFAIRNCWRDFTVQFHDRLKYLVLRCADRDREFPLWMAIWTNGQLVKPM